MQGAGWVRIRSHHTSPYLAAITITITIAIAIAPTRHLCPPSILKVVLYDATGAGSHTGSITGPHAGSNAGSIAGSIAGSTMIPLDMTATVETSGLFGKRRHVRIGFA